ncbi:MAG TPA: sulfatase-like hydrolase/transferase [Acidimicrobiales bacterium]|nr:sulfatase-like hydrolase/transferase [Acidimicrobiales bacterium]
MRKAAGELVSDSAPNILLVMSDQHRADMMGCAGDPSVLTPSLDALAAEGARFSRVSCQGPLCMPSRASFMTERYVRDHGVYTNWEEIAPDTPTYAWALRDAGYHTSLLGKAHLYQDEKVTVPHIDDMASRLQALGFAEVFETGDKFIPKIPNRYTDYLAGEGLLEAYKRHVADRSYQGDNEDGQNATKCLPMWDATPMPLPLQSYVDTWHGQQAVRWIEQYDKAQPFFLFVGFPGPHDPWDAPAEAVERYRDIEISMPASTRRPATDGTGRYGALLNGFLWVSDSESMTDDAIRAMRRAYAADISVIDHAVGLMVDALARTGLLENTWIIYTSDHGEMAGSHGLMSKCVLYEPAVRVPLIIRPPGGREGLVVDTLTEHLDVPATVRHIAGAPSVEHGEGRSLVGSVRDGAPGDRTVAVSENWGFAVFETDRYKLVVDEDACSPCQLFDLSDDPHEDTNLVADPQSADVVGELMESYVRPFFRTPPARPHPSLFTGGE